MRLSFAWCFKGYVHLFFSLWIDSCSVECFLCSFQTSFFSSTSSLAMPLPVFSTALVFTPFTWSSDITVLLVNTEAFYPGIRFLDFCGPCENVSKQARRWECWPQWWCLNILELGKGLLSVAWRIREESVREVNYAYLWVRSRGFFILTCFSRILVQDLCWHLSLVIVCTWWMDFLPSLGIFKSLQSHRAWSFILAYFYHLFLVWFHFHGLKNTSYMLMSPKFLSPAQTFFYPHTFT